VALRKRALWALVLGIILLVFAFPAFAGTTTFSGTLTLSDPVYPYGRPDTPTCSIQIDDLLPNKYHFQTRQISVSVTGTYNYLDLFDTIDIEVAVFNGPFDPNNPLTNCMTSMDDAETITLEAGKTYLLAITSWDMPNVGSYAFRLTGPGDVFEVEVPATATTSCDVGAPEGAVLRTLTAETPAYFEADAGTATGFTIPAGTWFTYDAGEAFTHLWVTCGANPVWVATSALR
jgi:hypothetical protein